MKINDELLNIIKEEDIRNPLTDQELADILCVNREKVTNLRKELNIPNSRERGYPYLKEKINELVDINEEINIVQVTNTLNEMGFDVSRTLVTRLIDDMYYEVKNKRNMDPFRSIIGYDGSLKSSILQAKAAILYPPYGLPTIIVGESGVGKTYFAQLMYSFAINHNIIKPQAPFKIFNCADYSDNSQLLLSVLFGYKKGAFTGADQDTKGIVEEANDGVLFLDEVHRLPPKGQEILFSILDHGKFRRLGETSNERVVRIMFICATTEDIKSSLLLSFRRRIPMTISIPSLEERGDEEKVDLIRYFLQQESNRLNLNIFIESKVIEILTMKYYEGNIGQLESEIQVLCAKAYMKHLNSNSKTLNIGINEIMDTSDYREIEKLTNNFSRKLKKMNDMLIIPFINEKTNYETIVANNSISMNDNIYKLIEHKHEELTSKNCKEEFINREISKYIDNSFEQLKLNSKKKDSIVHLSQLENIIDKDIINSVKKLRDEINRKVSDGKLNESILTYLAIHVQETLQRLRLNQKIYNPNLDNIKKEHREAYTLALKFADILEIKKNISLPEDEIGFIAMYIKTAIEKEKQNQKVAIVVICHGHVASEMVKVVKQLTNENCPIAIDMPLETHPSEIYEKVLSISKTVDEGKGILFLVDMGSLVHVSDMVQDKLGINTRVLDRVDLLTVLEATRRASLSENTLDSIYLSLIKSKNLYPVLPLVKSDKMPAVVALCITSNGTAKKIEQILMNRYSELQVFTLGMIDEELENKVREIDRNYNLICIVGTINPEIEGISFIPFDPDLTRLDGIFNQFLYIEKKNDFKEFVEEDLIIVNPKIRNKNELLEIMCSILINKGYVKRDFLSSVLRREENGSTFLGGGVGIPHGNPSEVIHPSLVFVKLDRPINWGNGLVNVVCLPALKYDDKRIIQEILKIFSNEDILNKIKLVNTRQEFKEILLSCNLEG